MNGSSSTHNNLGFLAFALALRFRLDCPSVIVSSRCNIRFVLLRL